MSRQVLRYMYNFAYSQFIWHASMCMELIIECRDFEILLFWTITPHFQRSLMPSFSFIRILNFLLSRCMLTIITGHVVTRSLDHLQMFSSVVCYMSLDVKIVQQPYPSLRECTCTDISLIGKKSSFWKGLVDMERNYSAKNYIIYTCAWLYLDPFLYFCTLYKDEYLLVLNKWNISQLWIWGGKFVLVTHASI